MGPDKYGNIVSVQPMGRARPRTVMRLGRVSELYRASILEAEACMSLLRFPDIFYFINRFIFLEKMNIAIQFFLDEVGVLYRETIRS